MSYFNCHSHTHYSNIRLLDCINRPKDLINKAIDLGLTGIAITDHECLSGHIEINQYAKDILKTNPDFTIALGNEIYLTETRESGQKYYHFILIAKDAIGHRQMRELSSRAWMNSYVDRRMERVPLLKSELEEIVKKEPGHLIATTACLGGELGDNILKLEKCEAINDIENTKKHYLQIVNLMEYCVDLFGEDFYIECAPANNADQISANKRMAKIASAFNVKMCLGTDAHYLTKEDRYVHKAYLNSKGGEREVDSFYEFTYLMDAAETRELLKHSFSDEGMIDWIFNNSNEMRKKIKFFDLSHPQTIAEVEVKDYPKNVIFNTVYTTLSRMLASDNIQERYWVNECLNKLKEKDLFNETYLARLEEEADTKRTIGEKLGTNMFAYPNTLQHYIDLFWRCGSMVGAGRGSSCSGLNHYLLGITQLDPIKWDLPWFRYMNKERVELGDIDLDLCPSKRPAIIKEIKAERAARFNDDIDEFFKENLGCTLVATFGTETTKSAIQTACRGYRSEEHSEGIDVDEAQYLSSLVPSERGFLWPIHDVVYGNADKDRRPVTAFLATIKQYPGLLDIIMRIEGLINKRSSHASGVILFDEDPFKFGCFMKTPKGEIITQYDLHTAEAAGMTKYDFLVTEVQDKEVQAIQLMQEENLIESDLTLREVYDKYLHPEILPLENIEIWKALHEGTVINVFQFDSDVGAKAAKKILPTNIQELTDANGLMRLMTGEKGEENPIDKYIRYKNNISLWYDEMDRYGLTKEEQKILEPHFKPSYGVPPSQEQMMLMLMDENICGFTLAEGNMARKIVGKKQMAKIPELKEKVLTQAKSPALGEYVWKCGIGPQMGYSFSKIHALAYSMIGVQTLYLATNWDSIYWNTACLIVNSGATDEDNGGQTDYSKIAKAIGDIREHGIQISLVDINKSDFGFKPDVTNNQILFGLKGMLNVGDDLIKEIIENRPYASMMDFYEKVKPSKQAMIALIKGGAFDNFQSRKKSMVEFIWLTCDKKKRLTLQNMPGLIKYDLLPKGGMYDDAKRVYEFNRYLKAECKSYEPERYLLDSRAINFLNEIDCGGLMHSNNIDWFIKIKDWDKVYQSWMDIFRTWITNEKESILDKLNTTIFMEDWNKYASGTLSAWEMEVLCFYYHEHELAGVNMRKYGISNFSDLSPTPVVEKTFKRGGVDIPIYKLDRICGTCIAKNKTKSTVYLLTTDGVVPVKFRQEYFSMFDKQISIKQEDGTKKVVEKSWFNRGNMIMVQGIRRDDEFVPKRYSSTPGHQLYHIDTILENGDIELRHTRAMGMEEEDE